jgi:hypothetical protein
MLRQERLLAGLPSHSPKAHACAAMLVGGAPAVVAAAKDDFVGVQVLIACKV